MESATQIECLEACHRIKVLVKRINRAKINRLVGPSRSKRIIQMCLGEISAHWEFAKKTPQPNSFSFASTMLTEKEYSVAFFAATKGLALEEV